MIAQMRITVTICFSPEESAMTRGIILPDLVNCRTLELSFHRFNMLETVGRWAVLLSGSNTMYLTKMLCTTTRLTGSMVSSAAVHDHGFGVPNISMNIPQEHESGLAVVSFSHGSPPRTYIEREQKA
jgi:hypothetical protein